MLIYRFEIVSFTFLIFLISESSSDGAAAGLALIFSLSLSSPAICRGEAARGKTDHSHSHTSLLLTYCTGM